MNYTKLLSITITLLLVVNLTLFALGKISVYLFWIIIILGALFAYFGIPYLSKKKK